MPGTFAWDNPDFVFTGAGDFAVVFTPDDTENYNAFSVMVHIDPLLSQGGSARMVSFVKIQKTDPGQPVTAKISVAPTVDSSGHATATVPEKSVTDAIAKALAEAADREELRTVSALPWISICRTARILWTSSCRRLC